MRNYPQNHLGYFARVCERIPLKRLAVVDHPAHAEPLFHMTAAHQPGERVRTLHGGDEILHRLADEPRRRA